MKISTVQLQPVFGDRNTGITSHHHHIALIYCDRTPRTDTGGIISGKSKAMGVSHCNDNTVF